MIMVDVNKLKRLKRQFISTKCYFILLGSRPFTKLYIQLSLLILKNHSLCVTIIASSVIKSTLFIVTLCVFNRANYC